MSLHNRMSRSTFSNKTILITGGTGSFGRAFVRSLLSENACEKIIILSRDEWKQWEMQHSDPVFNDPKMRYFLGDVRDKERLVRAFEDVDYIVHAAALKQVPAAEYNPSEFIKTNINGALNVVDAAIECNVEKVIALSTDKAVNPINLYGATKLCSDKVFCAGNSYVGAKKQTIFSVVRYGNVINSRGSLIPLWRKLIDEGALSLPLTDPRMTRFWITLPQAVDFVIKAFSEMRGGEIFIPKIPSMKITDLAQAMAPHLQTHIVGIRPGEKLHELMVSREDANHSLEFESYYLILPQFLGAKSLKNSPDLIKRFLSGRKFNVLPEGFAYTSDNNTQWIGIQELQTMLAQL